MLRLLVVAGLFVSLGLWSCSKGGDGGGGTKPSVSTSAATSITPTSAVVSAIVSNEGSSGSVSGLCWNTSPGPVIGSNNITLSSGTGTFPGTISGLTPNTTYYVRAYATNNAGGSYGNEISFTTLAAASVTTVQPTDIISRAVLLKGTSLESPGTPISSKGFCVSTTPNPNMSSPIVVYFTTGGSGDYSVAVSSLQSNTTYYFKAFATTQSGQTVFGAEQNFKTTGYFGASGGYVFYDKGVATDGWRYLESAPVELHYNAPANTGAYFGCFGTNLTLTYPEMGKGLENTSRIVTACASANCAARLCANYTVNSLTGWFLPSSAEMLTLVNSLYPLGVLTPVNRYWSSTELTAANATAISYNLTTAAWEYVSDTKNTYYTVRPVRRY